MNILVADVDGDRRKSLVAVLEAAGHSAAACAAQAECVRLLDQQGFELLLVTATVLGQGAELRERLSEIEAGGGRRPYLMLVGPLATRQGSGESGAGWGVDDVLSDPDSRPEVLFRVERAQRLLSRSSMGGTNGEAGGEEAIASEMRYRTLLESSRDAIMLLDEQGFFDCNAATLELFGLATKEEFKGCHPGELSPPTQPDGSESVAAANERIRDALENGSCHFDWVHQRRDGEIFEADVLLTAFPLGGRQVLQATVRNMTERRLAEKAIRESERKLRAVINQTYQFIGLLRTDGTLVDVNDTALAFSGIEREAVIDRPFWEGPWWSHSQELREKLREAVRTAAAGGFVRFEATHPAKDGSIHFVDFSLKPVVDDGGNIILLVPEGRDITEFKRAEEALRNSDRRYRTLHENLRDGLAVVDMAGTIIEHNPAFEEMLGYSATEIRALTYEQITPHRWHAQEARILKEQVLRRGYSDIYEKEYLRKDGTVFPVELQTYLERNESGEPQGMWAFVRDITDRKQAQEALLESERRMSHIFNFLPDATLVIDRAGTVIAWNRAMEELTGVAAEAMLGKGEHEYAVPFYGERRPILVDLVLRSREELETKYSHFKRDGDSLTAETYVARMRPGGVFLLGRASALRDSKGNVVGAIEIVRDVTERKRAEEALRLSEREFRALFDKSNDAIYIHDLSAHILDANQAACDQLGYARDQLRTMLATDVDTPDQAGRVPGRIAALKEHGRALFESVHRRRDGTLFPVEVSSSFMEYRGVVAIISICRDITERKRTEEALRRAKEAADAANEAKGAFLANMSHEIRTPINGMLGMIGLALDSDLTVEQRGYLELARSSADALLTIINDILDFSKIEAQKLEIEAVDFDLLALLERSLLVLGAEAQHKGIELIYDLDTRLRRRYRGDPTRVGQVVANLVKNAIKFTEKGHVLLRVQEEECADAATAKLLFSVEDTGIGIPPDKLTTIFGTFTQADSSTTRRYGGTGLGLAISKNLVQMMGGEISLDSKVGQGTRVEFTVVLGVAQGRPEVEEPVEVTLEGLRALVVDDNALNRQVLRQRLLSWGIRVREAKDGADCLAEIEASRSEGRGYDLLLLDQVMPGMSGLEVVERITGIGLAGATIVMLTSLDQSEHRERCRELGVGAYLVKPVSPSTLLDAIVSVVGQAPQQGARTRKATREPLPALPVVPPDLAVLLSEDNLVNRKLAVALLGKVGIHPDTAENGLEVLRKVEARSYDLIFMDIQMPLMDGIEATRRIREIEKERGGHVPIVALTAHAMKGDMERFLAAGMDDYLTKPLSAAQLYRVVEKVVARRRGSSTLDLRALRVRVGDDDDLAADLLALYREEAQRSLRDIETGVAGSDAEQVRASAHSLKGMSANVSALAVQELALALEQASKAHDMRAAAEIAGRLRQTLVATLAEVDVTLSRLRKDAC